MKNIVLGVILILVSLGTFTKELYRKSSSGDSGTYYVLSSSKLENGTIKVLTSRIGKSNAYTDFTELKVNCDSKQFFEVRGSMRGSSLTMYAFN